MREINLTNQDIDCIISSALECGGIAYWCSSYELVGKKLGEFACEQISLGGSIKLEEEDTGDWYTLDKETLLKGVRLWLNDDFSEHIDSDDLFDFDAEISDIIIQYAIFEEIIYG